MADSSAHHYPRTILRVGTAPPFEVDLRRAVPLAVARRLRGLGLGRRFGIVTPYNPGGVSLSGAANTRRLGAMAADLARRGLRAVPADGMSTDRRHVERGWAIAAPRAALIALARRLGQTAIFWFDGRRFLLVWCVRPMRGVALPNERRGPPRPAADRPAPRRAARRH